MRVCIDSNQFIFGIAGTDPAAEMVLNLVPYVETVLPRLIMSEVTRNLSVVQTKLFYALLARARVVVVEEPVPADLLAKYIGLGLPEKADAFIGAFAEWQQVAYLISDNRHFLAELKPTTFQVVSPDEFLRLYALPRDT